jgi:hypothetical protein
MIEAGAVTPILKAVIIVLPANAPLSPHPPHLPCPQHDHLLRVGIINDSYAQLSRKLYGTAATGPPLQSALTATHISSPIPAPGFLSLRTQHASSTGLRTPLTAPTLPNEYENDGGNDDGNDRRVISSVINSMRGIATCLSKVFEP